MRQAWYLGDRPAGPYVKQILNRLLIDLSWNSSRLEGNNPAAAQEVALHIIQNIEQLLPNNPQMGRPGRVPGTRELVIPKTPFVTPYRLQRNVIQILRVYHGARRWPESF